MIDPQQHCGFRIAGLAASVLVCGLAACAPAPSSQQQVAVEAEAETGETEETEETEAAEEPRTAPPVPRPLHRLVRPLRENERPHVVAAGESVSTLSKRYGVTPQDLRDINALGPDDLLRPGQHLIIPAADSPQDEPQVDKPKEDESHEFRAVPVDPVDEEPLDGSEPSPGAAAGSSGTAPSAAAASIPAGRPPREEPPPRRPVN